MVKHVSEYGLWRQGKIQQYSRLLLPLAIFGGAVGVYIKTMAVSVFWGDSAAFATSNYILGIPHSPSFPLYTLMGRLFNLIPGLEPAFCANLMSAFFAGLSVMVFFLLVRRFVEVSTMQEGDYRRTAAESKALSPGPGLDPERRAPDLEAISHPPSAVLLACLGATMLYAVSLPVWLSAVRAEVYS
ncbi:MAG: DUF2723 domain-containing protein, partial [Candidatus Zixiibacteriota bacterium]